MDNFIYIWFDTKRKMYYVGSHTGSIDDNYISSSPWFNGEYQYRQKDFKRRILSKHKNKSEMVKEEYRIISMFELYEFGKKYYNLKCGTPSGKISDLTRKRMSDAKKGKEPWNKNKTDVYSEETRQKMSKAKKGKVPWNKGIKNPIAAQNGRKGAKALSSSVTGRKMAVDPVTGKRYWVYPEK